MRTTDLGVVVAQFLQCDTRRGGEQTLDGLLGRKRKHKHGGDLFHAPRLWSGRSSGREEEVVGQEEVVRKKLL